MSHFIRRLSAIHPRELLLLVATLFLAFDHAIPTMRSFAEEGDPGSRAALGTAFTYQGRLDVDGVPATGSYDLEFALFDEATGGVALQTLPVLTGVPVENGLFTVQLAFNDGSFQGDQRWLQVRSRPDAQTAFTLLGRSELTATPYALFAKTVAFSGDGSATTAARGDHTHLGQAWSSGLHYRALQVTNTNTATGASAIHGVTTGELTAGVIGEASLGGVGVVGASVAIPGDLSPDRTIGVVGRACDPGPVCRYRDGDGANSGVYGESVSGAGVVGQGSTTTAGPDIAGVVGRGLYGMSASGTSVGLRAEGVDSGVRAISFEPVGSIFSPNASVVGRNLGTCTSVAVSLTGYCVGVWGTADVVGSSASIGVVGYGRKYGVYGDAPPGYWGIFSTQRTYSAVGYEQASDERLKTDAAPGAGLAEILRLQPRSYRWLNPDMDDGRRHQGLFAQEVLDVLPGIVTWVEGPGEGHYAMKYSELIPVLIRAIQEQQAMIEALQAGR